MSSADVSSNLILRRGIICALRTRFRKVLATTVLGTRPKKHIGLDGCGSIAGRELIREMWYAGVMLGSFTIKENARRCCALRKVLPWELVEAHRLDCANVGGIDFLTMFFRRGVI